MSDFFLLYSFIFFNPYYLFESINWLTNQVTARITDHLTDRLTDRFTYELTDRLTDKLKNLITDGWFTNQFTDW